MARLLQRNLGRAFDFEFGRAGYHSQPKVVAALTELLRERYPDRAAKLLGDQAENLQRLKQTLAGVAWEHGDSQRGQKLFQRQACARCHGGRQALGPDLAGVAQRFSRDDLFAAVALPNRDVSPRYQTTMIQTTDGKIYSGLILYESVDGLTLRNGTNQTFRIEADEIEFRHKANLSLMPNGLLKDLRPADLADLYAYLRSLKR